MSNHEMENFSFDGWVDQYIMLVYQACGAWLWENAGLQGSCRFAQVELLRDAAKAAFDEAQVTPQQRVERSIAADIRRDFPDLASKTDSEIIAIAKEALRDRELRGDK